VERLSAGATGRDERGSQRERGSMAVLIFCIIREEYSPKKLNFSAHTYTLRFTKG
jgi:hypothetical protein